MKKFLTYHTTDKFSLLDGFVLALGGSFVGQSMYAHAVVTGVVGMFVSAVITVLVERIR